MDDEIQDLNKVPLDVEEKMIQMLSDELAKEIDKDILNGIFDSVYQEELERYNKNENRKKKISDIIGEEYVPSKPPEKGKFNGTL
jgi:hypothetical protein